MFQKLVSLVPLLVAAPSALAASYNLEDNFVGSSFFTQWSHQAIADPTHGRVNYVDQATAQRLNLSFASSSSFVMRADASTTLSSSGPGRNSVRLQSNKQYGANTVVIWDLRHMPEGCGSWPAAWTVGDDWPNNGEIDVVEGVNNQEPNQATLHTSTGCTMPSSNRGSGHVGNLDCQGNNGCGIQADAPDSFGPQFNSIGGGVYAMERTGSFIKAWYWARNDGSIPGDVSSHSNTINTSNWPTPFANFPNNQCNINQFFGPHNLIFDLTFCGDFAGNPSVYAASGCPSTCVDFVNNNPGAFNNAFWDIASVRTFAA